METISTLHMFCGEPEIWISRVLSAEFCWHGDAQRCLFDCIYITRNLQMTESVSKSSLESGKMILTIFFLKNILWCKLGGNLHFFRTENCLHPMICTVSSCAWWRCKIQKNAALPTVMGRCSSGTQSCPTLFDPKDSSTPGSPVLHCPPEFVHIHVRRI